MIFKPKAYTKTIKDLKTIEYFKKRYMESTEYCHKSRIPAYLYNILVHTWLENIKRNVLIGNRVQLFNRYGYFCLRKYDFSINQKAVYIDWKSSIADKKKFNKPKAELIYKPVEPYFYKFTWLKSTMKHSDLRYYKFTPAVKIKLTVGAMNLNNDPILERAYSKEYNKAMKKINMLEL